MNEGVADDDTLRDLEAGDEIRMDDETLRNDALEHMRTYTDEQRGVHDAVMRSVLHGDRDEANFFELSAPAGTGKTHVYNGLVKDCNARGLPVIACAYTAIAALLLPGGETCHRAFGMAVHAPTDGTARSHIEASSAEGWRLAEARLVLIDEVSMLAGWQATLIDCLFRVRFIFCRWEGNVGVLNGLGRWTTVFLI
jgi:hypothetical protein